MALYWDNLRDQPISVRQQAYREAADIWRADRRGVEPGENLRGRIFVDGRWLETTGALAEHQEAAGRSGLTCP